MARLRSSSWLLAVGRGGWVVRVGGWGGGLGTGGWVLEAGSVDREGAGLAACCSSAPDPRSQVPAPASPKPPRNVILGLLLRRIRKNRLRRAVLDQVAQVHEGGEVGHACGLRSEERRVGKVGVRTCTSRGVPEY